MIGGSNIIPVDLTGPTLKLERAREHIEGLRAEIDQFVGSEPAPFATEVEIEPGSAGLRVHSQVPLRGVLSEAGQRALI